MDTRARRLAWLLVAGSLGCVAVAVHVRASQVKPTAMSVELDRSGTAGRTILGGPPETVAMRSGSVVLLPSKAVGRHNTDDYEEAIVVLAGTGEMRIANGPVLTLKPYVVAYCPPGTEHDVINTGSEPLRYVYVVAKVQ